MALAEATNDFSLQIRRTLKATPEQVFSAWITAEQVGKWFSPSRQHETRVHLLEPDVGGRYRFELSETDGETHIVGGEYVSITPPKQLIFTWAWEHADDPTPMLVTVDLNPVEGGTELVLTHERLPDETLRDLHNQGWNACLDGLNILYT